jgi:hypothetical protein
METLRQDVRYALRNLCKAPGFAVVAALTLALGIGASTAIFSILENIPMEPFPYPDAQSYMSMDIHDTEENHPGGRGGFSGPKFLDYATQNHVFDRVIANDRMDVLYRSGEGTQLLRGNAVTPGTFEFLGMSPLLGRTVDFDLCSDGSDDYGISGLLVPGSPGIPGGPVSCVAIRMTGFTPLPPVRRCAAIGRACGRGRG